MKTVAFLCFETSIEYITVKDKPTIALYGNSMFIAGVAASLRHVEDIDVVRLPPSRKDIEDQLYVSYPDAVVIELNESHADFAIAFLRKHPGLPLIGLDLDSNCVFVLHSRCSTATDVQQLADMIQMQFTTKNALVPAEASKVVSA